MLRNGLVFDATAHPHRIFSRENFLAVRAAYCGYLRRGFDQAYCHIHKESFQSSGLQ